MQKDLREAQGIVWGMVFGVIFWVIIILGGWFLWKSVIQPKVVHYQKTIDIERSSYADRYLLSR